MHIASVGSMPQTAAAAKTPEAVEGPGPDHDGDSDNTGAAAKSATAPGVGGLVGNTA